MRQIRYLQIFCAVVCVVCMQRSFAQDDNPPEEFYTLPPAQTPSEPATVAPPVAPALPAAVIPEESPAGVSGLVIPRGVRLTLRGSGGYEAGQVVAGMRRFAIPYDSLDHIWQQRVYAGFEIQATIQERFNVYVGGEGSLVWGYPVRREDRPTMETTKLFYITRSEATYGFGDIEHPFIELGAGYFPYDYNTNNRNFGDYLFRTGTYPLFMKNEFDFAMARLLGLRVTNTLVSDGLLINSLRQDLMLHSETEFFPTQDYSLSYVANAKLLNRFVDVGVGFSAAHLFSVYNGWYSRRMNQDWTDRKLVVHVVNKYDPATGDSIPDTLDVVTFRGEKVMAQIALDPKALIEMVSPGNGFLRLLGKDDFKLYGEVAIIGLKNHPKLFYRHLEDRMPFVLGLNLPGFKVIDVINTEWEYCSNPYAYSLEMVLNGDFSQTPVPRPKTLMGFDQNPWRWSVYVKKTFFDGNLGFIGQAARDHLTIKRYYFTREDYGTALVLPHHWWWTLKIQYGF